MTEGHCRGRDQSDSDFLLLGFTDSEGISVFACAVAEKALRRRGASGLCVQVEIGCLPRTQVASSPLDATGETRILLLFFNIEFIHGLDRDLS